MYKPHEDELQYFRTMSQEFQDRRKMQRLENVDNQIAVLEKKKADRGLSERDETFLSTLYCKQDALREEAFA